MDNFILNNRFGIVIVNELIRLVNGVIHTLGITYSIAELRGDYNRLNNEVGHNTAAINAINEKIDSHYLDVVYVGIGENAQDVINDNCKHENFELGGYIEVNPDNQNIIVCYPSDIANNIVLSISGIDIPVSKTTETYNGAEYIVLKSLNTYETQFSFVIR